MKILVIGAYGKVGRLVIAEAAARGIHVTGVARRPHDGTALATEQVIVKDVMALTGDDLRGYDAVVDAVGVWDEQSAPVLYEGLHQVVQRLRGTDTRFLKVGGTNTLYIDADHNRQLGDLPEYYPPEFTVLCDAHAKALAVLRTYSNIAWTYVTPALDFSADGPATGLYRVAGEEFVPNREGGTDDNGYISYADYATGLVDIIEQGQYVRQRITLIHDTKPTQ